MIFHITRRGVVKLYELSLVSPCESRNNPNNMRNNSKPVGIYLQTNNKSSNPVM